MTSAEKTYPFGVEIYMEQGELKTSMTDAVQNVVFAAFPDLDDRRDAILTERIARLVKLKAALDDAEQFAVLNLDFYESIQRTGHDDLMAMFTPRNVAIFHNSIRILTTNTITNLMAASETEEQLAVKGLLADCKEQVREDIADDDFSEDEGAYSGGDSSGRPPASDDKPTLH